MDPKSINLRVIAVSLCLVLVLAGSAWIDDASADFHTDDARTTQPASLAPADWGLAPAYDSGWDILGTRVDPISVEFTHNLGGNPNGYIVDLQCWDDTSLGTYDCTSETSNINARWYGLTSTTIKVYIPFTSQPDAIRVRIYRGTPSYNSGWDILGIRVDPISVEFTHNLGGNPNSYIVDLQCQDDTSLGTYDCTSETSNINARWYGLTSTTIKVHIPLTSQPDAIRVRIYRGTPSYNSGWDILGIRVDPITVAFTHNLGGNPDSYVVELRCQDDTSLGTYDCTSETSNINARWYGLTSTTINVHIPLTSQPDSIRVRIWRRHTIYLPLVVRDY